MSSNNQLLVQEAINPRTASERLRELSNEWSDLRPIIASNPNCDFSLLNDLALSHPSEVLSNPILSMAAIEKGNAYLKFSLKSLVGLLMARDQQEHNALIDEIRCRICAGIEALRGQEEASLTCTWLYQRTFVLTPDACNNLISEPIELEAEIRAHMEGSGPLRLYGVPDFAEDHEDAPEERKKELEEFFLAIASGRIRDYLCDDEIIREDGTGSSSEIKATTLPEGLDLNGEVLYKVSTETDQRGKLLEFVLHFCYDEDAPLELKGGYVHVPVGCVDEIDHKYDIAMGELGDLAGLKIHASETGLEIDWPSRLAELLLPS